MQARQKQSKDWSKGQLRKQDLRAKKAAQLILRNSLNGKRQRIESSNHL